MSDTTVTDPAPARPKWQRQLPNALSCARVVMAALFVAMLATYSYAYSTVWVFGAPYIEGDPARRYPPDWWLINALAVFVVAAITDALDGYLARKWRVVSIFGRVMDPFADKVLVLGAMIILAGSGFAVAAPADIGHIRAVAGFAPWMVVVILGRELLVTSLRGVMESRGVDFSATASGKMKMILQSIAVPVVLLLLAVHPPLHEVRNGLFERTWSGWTIDGIAWATTLVSAWSGAPYVLRAARATRAARGAAKP